MSSMAKAVAVLIVGVISLGVIAAAIAGVSIDGFVLGLAICVFLWAAFVFAVDYWFRRTHTPEERAALAAKSQLEQDRYKFARGSITFDKRKVLRTGAEARAVVTAVDQVSQGISGQQMLLYLELAVTVGADPPYAVRTGELVVHALSDRDSLPALQVASSLRVGRELVVRVDPNNRRRVAVDWKQSAAPALRLQELERLHTTGAISDAEYTANRKRIIADT